MLKTIEAEINENGGFDFKEPVRLIPHQKVLITILDKAKAPLADAQLSEKALARDWLRPEEDQAWQHLQKAR